MNFKTIVAKVLKEYANCRDLFLQIGRFSSFKTESVLIYTFPSKAFRSEILGPKQEEKKKIIVVDALPRELCFTYKQTKNLFVTFFLSTIFLFVLRQTCPNLLNSVIKIIKEIINEMKIHLLFKKQKTYISWYSFYTRLNIRS